VRRTSARRLVSIPAILLIAVLSAVTAPLCYAVAVAADLASRRQVALTATLAWIHTYIVAELLGMAACLWLWLLRPWLSEEQWIERHYRLARTWGRLQFEAARRLYHFRVDVSGDDVLDRGPYLLLCRHVSIVDNLLPTVLAESVHGMRLRWVFDRRLLRQPTVDILGHRLPSVFVEKNGASPVADLRRVARLADGIGPNDAIAIFPEGTLFAPSKRASRLTRLRSRRRSASLVGPAEELRNVLPPELGAVLVLLKAPVSLDVVFCAHSGLEDGLNRASIARGGIKGRTLRVNFWRVPASKIPDRSEDRRAWLLGEWKKLDAFVTDALGTGTDPAAS